MVECASIVLDTILPHPAGNGKAMSKRFLEQRNGITFIECLEACINSELVSEWQRLSSKQLIASSAIGRMIDEATGYDMAVMGEFADFVYTYVFHTL